MQGGFGLIRSNNKSFGLIRFPIFIFRPSQSDILHFDLWHKGINLLRDGGTFSYNSSVENMKYFSGIDSHNTIKFDNKEPMKKFSRFLFLDWPKTKFIKKKFINKNSISISAMYEFKNGSHLREIISKNDGSKWIIIDDLSKYSKCAKLQWRLAKSNWKISKNIIESKNAKITILSSNKLINISLIDGWESQFYDHKNKIKVAEIILKDCPASIKTIIELK